MASQFFDTNTSCYQKPDLLYTKKSDFRQAPNRGVITLVTSVLRSSWSQMFYKTGVPKNFEKLIEEHLLLPFSEAVVHRCSTK